jgi:hypothetical protein
MFSFIRFENTTTSPSNNSPQLLISSNVPETTNILLKYPAVSANVQNNNNDIDFGQYFGVQDWPQQHSINGERILDNSVSFYHPKTGGFLSSLGQQYTTKNAAPTTGRLVGSNTFLPPEEVDHYFLISAGTTNQVQALYMYKTPSNQYNDPEKHFVVSDPFSKNVVLVQAANAAAIPTGLGAVWKAYVKSGSVPTE